jgi:MFS transporter, DHA1 family, inner membrane transport protein
MPTRRLRVLIAGSSFVATIGATAWTVVPPRFMSWVGLVFVVGALGCSLLGERAARQTNPL